MSQMTTANTRAAVKWPHRFDVLEPFGFANGTRLAWVTWQLDGPFAERRAVSVREVSP